MVAIKFNDDKFFDNEFYSKIGGISCVELNSLEYEILEMLNYGLVVTSEEYDKYSDHIERLYSQSMAEDGEDDNDKDEKTESKKMTDTPSLPKVSSQAMILPEQRTMQMIPAPGGPMGEKREIHSSQVQGNEKLELRH